MTFPVAAHKEAAPFGTYRVMETVTFDGDTGSGEVGTVALFTVTGEVWVQVVSYCTAGLTEAGATATIEVGTAADTDGLIVQTDAVDILTDYIWTSAVPAQAAGEIEAIGGLIGGGDDIIATIGTQNVTDGTLVFICFWTPLSTDGNVVAA